jgi:phosphorylcholine metabolism protein LicD
MKLLHPNGYFEIKELVDKPAFEVLKEASSYMKGHWWISAGTLLGLERENQLLPHDTDIDIGHLGEIEDINFLPDTYVPVRIVIGDNAKLHQVVYMHTPTQILFDVYMMYDKDGKYGTQGEKGWNLRTKELVDTLTEKEYLGHTFPVPHDIEAYLTEWYGDWRTPVKNYKTIWQK